MLRDCKQRGIKGFRSVWMVGKLREKAKEKWRERGEVLLRGAWISRSVLLTIALLPSSLCNWIKENQALTRVQGPLISGLVFV